MAIDFTLVVPIYKNEDLIPDLMVAVEGIRRDIGCTFEAVFVVDGSPDLCFIKIKEEISRLNFPSQLILLSKNFGSFSAIRAGLEYGRGRFFGVMAADLQEPPELLIKFHQLLATEKCDVVVGVRRNRSDPFFTKMTANLFWYFYRKYIFREMPVGGVDIFGCNSVFRDHLLQLNESRTSLIAQLFWMGFDREYVVYDRRIRVSGKSSWTMNKKIQYMLDSIFSFSDLPITLLIKTGIIGIIVTVILSIAIILFRFMHLITVPGYVPIMLSILFCSSLNLMGFGIVGVYAWRGYENSKNRPISIVSKHISNNKS